jgi:hypothetical protein
MAAAAASLNGQAGKLVNAVAVFKLAHDAGGASYSPPSSSYSAPRATPRPSISSAKASGATAARPALGKPQAAATKAPAKAPAINKAASLAAPQAKAAPAQPAKPAKAAGGDDEWESF